MPSLDFIYDLTSKLKSQNIDYFLISISKDRKEEIVNIFENLSDDNSLLTILKIFRDMDDAIKQAQNKKSKKKKPKPPHDQQ